MGYKRGNEQNVFMCLCCLCWLCINVFVPELLVKTDLNIRHTLRDRQGKEEAASFNGDNQSPKVKLQNGRPQKRVSENQAKEKN